MPKSRRALGSRPVRHDPLRRSAPVVSEVKAEVVPVLSKLPAGPGEQVSNGEQVWALASISSLLDDEHGERNRRLLFSKNIVGRIIYALESNTDLEVRREASGALRNLCIDGSGDLFGEIANKGGIEAVLGCLRWATLGLQSHERQMERARAPAREARERLLAKPVEQMNRKERRQAAKLQAGTLPQTMEAHAEFAPDALALVDVQGWAADAPQRLASMDAAAAVCLVELCESLVTVLGCMCETSEKLLVRAVSWDWHKGALGAADAEGVRSAFAGDTLAAWLCEAVALGTAPQGPFAPQLTSLGMASANTLCALCDDAKYGLGKALVGLPSRLPTSKKARRREHETIALPTPSEMHIKRAQGSQRLALLAQAVALLPREGPVPSHAALGVITSGALCNIQRSVHAEEHLDAPVIVAEHGPLGEYAVHEILPRLVQMLANANLDELITQRTPDALQMVELALEIVAELASMLGRGDEQAEQLSITQLPLDDDDDDESDFEMLDDASDAEDEAMEREPARPGERAEPHALDHWVFAQLLQTPLLPVLVRLAAPDAASEAPDTPGAQRRAVQLRAVAAVNNFLLRFALFAPPPPSQWPSDEETLERVALWRAWVGTAYLEDAPAAPTPTGETLRSLWEQMFAVAAHWAAVPSVVEVETGVSDERASALSATSHATAAQDGLAIVDTCLGSLWSLARILEGQLPLVQDEAPAPYVTALQAAYQSARMTDVRVKSLGTLAVLARSQAYRVHAPEPPAAYLHVYGLLGELFVDAVRAACQDAQQAELLVASINAVMDTYANELAPWDPVYRTHNLQAQLTALVGPAARVLKQMDRRANVPLYMATQESLENLRAFLEYRESVH
ncbi:hypothetical protein MBRA1_000762 [Malassezia brasiliensis]|uniref:SYO1-like TPR repeats domain-containing protein n=1 Tax=Malassezia brasiliensis TaxID=1821822 RepID=A0AAF0DQF7_9BASI|nr:hypothetical protein MBRA1_000762 [Malassezia brasiliensis]